MADDDIVEDPKEVVDWRQQAHRSPSASSVAKDGWSIDWPEAEKTPKWEPWRLSYRWADVPLELKHGGVPGVGKGYADFMRKRSDGVQEAEFGRFMQANRDFRSEH